MYRHKFDEALELGATAVIRCRNSWWMVLFADFELASLFREYALDEGWTTIGSGLIFGVRPTL